jgi:biopolymer transport protein TolR
MSFGRLASRSSAQPMSDINMTPLVDVMLVLLVIFMLAAPLLASSIKLDLPQSNAAKAEQSAPFVTVVIDPSGQIYFNDKALDLTQLAQQLALSAQENPLTELQLRADSALPYGRLIEVMGVAQKANLNRIGFVTDETSGNKTPPNQVIRPGGKP